MYLTKFEGRIYNKSLSELSNDKIIISCLNAYSFTILQIDKTYNYALQKSHVILPDGIAIVFGLRFLTGARIKKISGHMLFDHEMDKLNQTNGRCFFLGSTEATDLLIKKRVSRDYPNVTMDFYSPPYKKEFDELDNQIMIQKINDFQPDVLFIGMTAPKQENWAATHYDDLNVKHICCIGAVFNFYAEPCKRAPEWMINMWLEWFFRLISEPKRLWRRYIFGNSRFLALIITEKLKLTGKQILPTDKH